MIHLIRSTQTAIARARKPLIAVLAVAACLALADTGRSQEHPGCFMINDDGDFIDLDDICPHPPEVDIGGGEEDLELGTGDVQVTLRWSTIDDLDLAVTGPSGDRISYANSSGSSGGQLDVDSNAACGDNNPSPVENIFWPEGGAPTGDFTIEVNLFTYCRDTQEPIPFTIGLLIDGQRREVTGTVDQQNQTRSFTFSFPPSTSGGGESSENEQ